MIQQIKLANSPDFASRLVVIVRPIMVGFQAQCHCDLRFLRVGAFSEIRSIAFLKKYLLLIWQHLLKLFVKTHLRIFPGFNRGHIFEEAWIYFLALLPPKLNVLKKTGVQAVSSHNAEEKLGTFKSFGSPLRSG